MPYFYFFLVRNFAFQGLENGGGGGRIGSFRMLTGDNERNGTPTNLSIIVSCVGNFKFNNTGFDCPVGKIVSIFPSLITYYP